MYARVMALAHLKPVADPILELWNIALAKQKPAPDPVSCIQTVAGAGCRLRNLTSLHAYMKSCREYKAFPSGEEIAAKLFPPGKKVDLSTVLPGYYSGSRGTLTGATTPK